MYTAAEGTHGPRRPRPRTACPPGLASSWQRAPTPVGPQADDCYRPKTVKSKIQNLCRLLEFWQQDCDLLKNPIFLLNVTRTDKTVRYVSPGMAGG